MILDDYQTYIGVLATFLVLCLYNTLDNFIFQTILKVGEGFRALLNGYGLQRKKIYDDQLFPKQEAIREMLANKCKENNNKNELKKIKAAEKEITKILNDGHLRISEFGNNAIKVVKKCSLGELQKSNNDNRGDKGDKEELTFVALSSLVFIIVTMCVDCFGLIPEASRAMFLFFLMAFSVPLYIFYYSFFLSISKKPNNPFSILNNKRIKSVIIVVFFISVLYIDSHFFLCLFLLFVVMMVCHFYYKQLYAIQVDQSRINHKFVIEHSVFVVVYAFLCTCVYYCLSIFDEKLQSEPVFIFVCSSEVAKYFCVVMFTLNSLLLPLLFGYYLMRRDMKLVRIEIDEISAKYTDFINDLCDELDDIKSRIENGDYNIFSKNKSKLEFNDKDLLIKGKLSYLVKKPCEGDSIKYNSINRRGLRHK